MAVSTDGSLVLWSHSHNLYFVAGFLTEKKKKMSVTPHNMFWAITHKPNQIQYLETEKFL